MVKVTFYLFTVCLFSFGIIPNEIPNCSLNVVAVTKRHVADPKAFEKPLQHQ